MILYEDFLGALPGAEQLSRYILGLCPFHSDTNRSLLVFKDGWFRCLGCKRQGSWDLLWNKLKGCYIFVTPELKTDWKGPDLSDISVEEVTYRANDELMRYPYNDWYLRMRGLEELIDTCQLGYWRGWYTIPIFTPNYEYVNTVFRAAPHVQEATNLRYWQRGDSGLYVPDHRIVERKRYLVVAYGMLDALSLLMLRIPAASPTRGQASVKIEWFDDYRMPIYVIPDQDEEESARKLVKELGWRGNLVLLRWERGIKDVNDYLKAGKTMELQVQLNQYIE